MFQAHFRLIAFGPELLNLLMPARPFQRPRRRKKITASAQVSRPRDKLNHLPHRNGDRPRRLVCITLHHCENYRKIPPNAKPGTPGLMAKPDSASFALAS